MSESRTSQPLTNDDALPTILIVDDDKDLADTYSVWLSGDFDVETAYSGVQAREQLHDDLDLVLLDRRMPGIPGDRVLEDIHDRGIDCQVAMLTAIEPDTDIIELPFDEYLVKPVSQSELREVVDELLLRQGFDADAQEYFAMESKTNALETRDEENLRDPEAAAALETDAERSRYLRRPQGVDLRTGRPRHRESGKRVRPVSRQARRRELRRGGPGPERRAAGDGVRTGPPAHQRVASVRLRHDERRRGRRRAADTASVQARRLTDCG